MFTKPKTVAAALSTFTKAADNLIAAAQAERAKAEALMGEAMELEAKAAEKAKLASERDREADRGMTVAARIQGLITVKE